jgi:FkbM family methyltransferase
VSVDEVVAEYRISFMDYVARLRRSRRVRGLAARRRRDAAPHIACFADDDIGAHILAHGWYEDLLLHALFDTFLHRRADAFRGGVALDVGANIGNHTLWFARRFARVVAFEPNPICTHLLQANLLMNGTDNVRLFALGLSDGSGERLFHANQDGNLGRSGLADGLAAGASRSFPVRVARGDDLLDGDSLDGRSVALVKLDIEGHELAALRGLATTVRTHAPVVLFESHRAGGDDGSDAIVAQLSDWGYRHFYVIETNTAPRGSRLRKLLHRLREGLRLRLREVARPDDRSHSLVIATTTPCVS